MIPVRVAIRLKWKNPTSFSISVHEARHRRQAQEDGEKDEQQAQPVHGQVKADPQGGDPGPVDLCDPRTRRKARGASPVPPEAGKERQVGGQGNQGNPACKPAGAPGCDPGCKPPRKGDECYPQQNHGNSLKKRVSPRATTVPRRTPTAYRRIIPDWVSTSRPDNCALHQESPP